MRFLNGYLAQAARCIQQVDLASLEKAVGLAKAANQKRKKLIIVGNGGSAAIASHVAVDLTKNTRVRAVNFNEADLITCFANDYGYEHWVSQALKFYGEKGDLLVLISSSGRSPNILNAARQGKKMGMKVLTFSGFDANNPLRRMGDINFWVDSKSYNFVEISHHVWLLAMTDKLADILHAKKAKG